MKHLRALGLVAVAAMGLMAFLGAGSASATVLCSTTSTPCNSRWAVNTILIASLDPGTSATLRDTSGFIKDTCSGSSVSGSITSAGDATHTVIGKASTLEFTGCTNTTVVNNGAACELEIHGITGTDNGTVTALGCTVTVEIGGFDCAFGATGGTDLGTLTEGNPATLDVNATVVTTDSVSPFCPQTAKWEAKYQVTSPGFTTIAIEPA